jgi:immune inhibitor A
MKRGWIIVSLVATTIIICGCALFSGMYVVGTFLDSAEDLEGIADPESALPTATPSVNRLLPVDGPSGLVTDANETIKSLTGIDLPVSDLRELAKRLEGKQNIPISTEPIEFTYSIGSQQVFWVSNVDSNENSQIDTTLQYATDHVYFWIEDGVPFEFEALKSLVDTFENEIYPKNRQFFGSEWTPGVDGDPHLYIIFAQGLGGNLAGYFSSADEHHPLAHEYSNAHEAFVLNADNVDLESEFAYAVLAHEFQHMIHWFRDRNESSWVNEGFSELAVFLNGYEVSSEYSYIINPDLQLNDWPNFSGGTAPHYGASFLFFTYFLDRFGQQATQEIVFESMNGLNGVDEVLRKNNIHDPLSGEMITADDVFSDWVIASFVKDESVADGRYTYKNFPGAPEAEATETIYECPTDFLTRDVHQFGVDYIRINCEGQYSLRFEGSSLVDVIPVSPYSGEYYFWSNKGDEGDMTLTKSFDFTNHEGPLTLSFYTWFDLEEDYDYLYLEISEDGESWQILETPSGTVEDPSGNSYGWGYNGSTNGWIEESIDLSDYSGKEVQIRFEYVTDAAVHGEGMVIDDISIPEIGYFTDFEEGEDGWHGGGWLRMNNVIPQAYRLSLITFGDSIEILPIPLQEDQSAEVNINIGDEIDNAVLVVSGTSRFSRQKAAYRIKVQ